MDRTIEALFDGTVLWPAEPLTLEPNTHVWIVIETTPPPTTTAPSFLRTSRTHNLDCPTDRSVNMKHKL